MREFLKSLLHPYYLAGLITWAAVVSMSSSAPLSLALLIIWLVAFFATPLGERNKRILWALLFVEAVCIVILPLFVAHPSSSAVLMVVFAAQLAMALPIRIAAVIALLLTCIYFAALSVRVEKIPIPMMLSFGGFQIFAMITAHYARTAELATQQLAQVNADLLATRALLESTTRHGERLRVSRDLHDVVGHKLTALRLNLRALAGNIDDPSLRLSESLTAEVLSDIRNVVSALRDTDGIDMETALRAMSRAFPRPSLQLKIDPGTVVDDPALSEVILRVCQEAMSNAAKHGVAEHIFVTLHPASLIVEDDGRVAMPLIEGNGLHGIRERVQAVGGEVIYVQSSRGGLRIEVTFA